MSSCVASLHFRFYPGATFTETVTLKDANNEPRDLTGYSARMDIRRELEDDAALFQLSTDDGTIEIDAEEGTIRLNIAATVTAETAVDWDGEVWVHDLLLSNDNEDPAVVERAYQGTILAIPGATR